MQPFREKLFSLIREGKTLIMPTEESARNLLSAFVSSSEEDCAIRSSQTIAFDRFRELLFPARRQLRRVDRISRLLFSSYLVGTKGTDLRYFIPNNDYPELLERIVYFISSLLPSLEEAERLETDSEARKDILLIKKEYDSFLESNGMYEPAYEDGMTMPGNIGDYVAVLSSASSQERRFLCKLGGLVATVDPEDVALPPLEVYENERQEIRNTFLRIRKLVGEGVDLSNIVITTPAYDRLRPYLESEGYLFSLPLSFRRGRSPLDYPAGNFLRLLRSLYENGYRIEDLRSFFLNPAFPFRNPDACHSFIVEAISRSVKQRERKDRYPQCDRSGDRIYADLIHYNEAINTTGDGEYMIREIKSLMEKIFLPEQFSSNKEDQDVFSFILREAVAFGDCASRLSRLGYLDGGTPLFPLFLRYLEASIYVPQEKVKGIAVYPLGQTSALLTDHHFVIELNEKEARESYQEAGFLADYEIGAGRAEEDSTKGMLNALCSMGSDCVFSASRSTYAGYALPLTEFHDQTRPEMLEDSYACEAGNLAERVLGSSIYPIQKKSHEKALVSALDRPGRTKDMTRDMVIPFQSFFDSRHVYSYSQIDSYLRCPYAYALDYVYALKEAQTFKSEDFPYLELGSRLHKVIENFFSGGYEDEEVSVPILFDAELDLWQERKTMDRDGSLKNLSPTVLQLTPMLREFIRARYLPGLIETVRRVKELGGTVELERKVEGTIGRLLFKGYIDCIVRYGESYRIEDFKTGSIPDESLQFEIYRELSRSEGQFAGAEYIAIKDGKCRQKKDLMETEELEKLLESVDESLSRGEFRAANRSESCSGCKYRGICRRRFFVQ